jgi:predicted patatin/cPLA2 family phospholipase
MLFANFKSFRLSIGLILFLPVLLAACSLLDRQAAVPPGERRAATVLGIPDARFFGDELGSIERVQEQALLREARHLGVKRGGVLPTAHLLALSGGGDNGAFGAGLLVGWTARGDRPAFKLVTGVSTGALIAIYAFLGPEYDPLLTEVYTQMDASRVFEERFLPVAAVAQDALSDTTPLYQTISHYFTEALMEKVAAEYQKGRLLAIQTTDLDAGRPVFWNIGAIAASGRPEALELIRHILLASAAIPAAFPPVLFDVEVNGKRYQELHVDGGAVSQSFIAPSAYNPEKAREAEGFRRKVETYVIRNGKLRADWSDVDRQTLSVAQKAVSVLTSYSGAGDLYKMYMIAKRGGSSFRLAYIGEDFNAPHPADFDRGYMTALYRYAFDKAKNGYPWENAPPGFQTK